MLCPSRTPNHLRTAFAQKQKRPHPSLGLKLLSSCVATTHPQSANSNSRPHKSNRPLGPPPPLFLRRRLCPSAGGATVLSPARGRLSSDRRRRSARNQHPQFNPRVPEGRLT